MESDLLTTGEVARLCGVTPDAVLKWIKKGRLHAIRTAGGHYRVSRGECAAMRAQKNPDAPLCQPGGARAALDRPLRCWEYFGGGGAPSETCRKCLVFRAKVERCYEVAEFGETVGHQRKYCKTDCQNCPFYRACSGLATEMLIITPDEALTKRLRRTADDDKLSLRFARSGYEGSVLVGTHFPAVVVMDSALPEVADGRLVEAIATDQRIPSARIFVASRKGTEARVERLGVSVIPAPFTRTHLEQIAETLASRAGASPSRAA